MADLHTLLPAISGVIVKAASHTITVAECNGRITFSNEGAGGLVTFTLPAAIAGLSVKFMVQDVLGIKVEDGGGDTIRLGAASSATGIQSTTVGDTVALICINAAEWIGLRSGSTGFATL